MGFRRMLDRARRTKDIMSRLDYGGIVLMITGSTFPPIMYGYACQNLPRYIILTVVTFASFMAFVLTVTELKFYDAKTYNTSVFLQQSQYYVPHLILIVYLFVLLVISSTE